MKTQQAHSDGETRFGAAMDSPRGAHPVLWLNLVCLDAPLVALAWLWLFARSFHVPLQIGNAVALFLTAWLIYLGDRFADALSLKSNLPRSARQEFCLRHREIWIATVALVAGFDAYVVWRTIPAQTFFAGAVIGTMSMAYLVANHPLGLIWRSLPMKEIAIGFLFAAGTMVALLPSLPITAGLALAVVTLAALCSLNCISIAVWERELDRTQGKVSLATRHPRVCGRVAKMCAGIALLSFAFAATIRMGSLVFVCAGASALLLAWLNIAGVSDDQRTALADLVLLTPLVPLLTAAL